MRTSLPELYRIAIAAPDGAAALELERRLAHLSPSTVAHRDSWVVDLPAAPDPGEVDAVVERWLGEIGEPSTLVLVDGDPHVVDAAKPRKRHRATHAAFIG